MIYLAIIGPGESATARDIADARAVGALCAGRGWIALTGGRALGVMDAAAAGVSSAAGISIGILPGSDRSEAAALLTASIPTGLGEARNVVLVTAAHGVIACGMSAGTLSEVALAVAARRPLALLGADDTAAALLASMRSDAVFLAASADDAVEWMAGQIEASQAD